jgi:hypothetical protein
MTEIYQKNSFDSTNSTEDSAEQLFYVEELSEQLIRKFNAQILEPYFKNVYQDLLLRSAPSKDNKTNTVDKVTLIEYINLPGILAERFYSLMANDNKSD